jgi:type I restriction enzyme S subunit
MNNQDFTNTEIGCFPKGWSIICLGDYIVDINDGPFGSNLKTEHYTSRREVRIIQLGNVGENGWNNDNVKYTSFEHAASLKRCIVPYGSVIIAKMMPAGRAILCPSSEPMYIQGSDVIKVSFSDAINKEFFVYLTKSKVYLDQIESSVQGSTRARTNIGKIKTLKLPLPLREEQDRIANALAGVDSLLVRLDEAIEKKRQIKEGLMQNLLTGRTRLYGSQNEDNLTSFWVQSELGPIPQGWRLVQLEDFIEDINDGPFGSNLKREHYTVDREVRIVQLGNVGENGWNDENVKYTTFTHAMTLKRCLIPYGSVIIAKMMPAGRAIICPTTDPMYIQGSDVIKVKFTNEIDNQFFVYFTKTRYYLEQIESSLQGSTRARTNIAKIKAIRILLPPLEEQKRIVSALSAADHEISNLESLRSKYTSIKQGMMQELLTGKTRLI